MLCCTKVQYLNFWFLKTKIVERGVWRRKLLPSSHLYSATPFSSRTQKNVQYFLHITYFSNKEYFKRKEVSYKPQQNNTRKYGPLNFFWRGEISIKKISVWLNFICTRRQFHCDKFLSCTITNFSFCIIL